MPLVVLEGIDGCGKTTQFHLLKEHFEEKKIPALFLREPGGTSLGERLRSLLLDRSTKAAPLSEMLLYMAARAQLLHEVVAPALQQKQLVVLDRYFYSTIAYQIFGLDLGKSLIPFIEAIPNLIIDQHPNLIIYLDISIEDSLKRRAALKKDRIEERGEAYLEKVRQGYESCINNWNDTKSTFIRIEAMKSKDEIHSQIVETISQTKE